jgi:alkylation response protein AidB-like acyl-CoA dehydrogenase
VTLLFSPEQDELRDSVCRFLADKAPMTAVRAYVDGGAYDDALYAAMAGQLGLTGLAVPEKFGGAGYSVVELGIVLEEMGRALTPSPYFATAGLAVPALLATDDDAAKAALLPGLADGSVTATLALAELDGRWDLEALATTASSSADGWTLDGTKAYVVDGHTADLLLVAARSSAGVGLYAVEATASGLTREHTPSLDLTRSLATVTLAKTPARLVGEADGAAALAEALDVVAVALAHEQVGGAARCLEMAVDYAKVRVQFGRPIGSFQAIKHMCAEVLLEVESARAAAYWSASELDSDEATLAAAMAQAYCSETYTHAAEANVQVHGGIGYTWEHDAHLYLRRAKSSELLFGTPGSYRDRLATLIGI